MKPLSAPALLLVAASTTPAIALTVPEVVGNTITWPDDGWYQVLDAGDYREVCAGGSSCVVDTGRYIVINHTSGQRFPGIRVGTANLYAESGLPAVPGMPTSPDAAGITVIGNTISWPDDGWYQVQRPDTFEPVCEGGRRCDVPDGAYVVINHTSGERFDAYVLAGADIAPDASVPPVTGDPVPAGDRPVPFTAQLDDAAPYLLESLAGYQLEQAQDYIATLDQAIVASALSSTILAPSRVPVVVVDEWQDMEQVRTDYACPQGGYLRREEAAADFSRFDYSQSNRLDTWRFRECRIDTDVDGLLAGEHVIDGELSRSEERSAGRRYSTVEQALTFSALSLRAPGDNRLLISATARVESFDSFNPRAVRNVAMREFSDERDGRLLRWIRDADFQFETSQQASGGLEYQAMSAEGSILGTATEGTTVTVSTIERLERTGVVNDDFAENRVPFKGQLQLDSSDGSVLFITAKSDAPDFRAPLLYDYTLLTADGNTVTGEAQPLPSFAIFAPAGDIFLR